MAAGLFVAAGSAIAAAGVTVTPKQEMLISDGMTADQVRAAIGGPERVVRYLAEKGPTWIYDVVGAMNTTGGEAVLFDVDFGADGKVARVGEVRVPGGPGE